MLAFLFFPVDLLSVAVAFITVMAGMLTAHTTAEASYGPR
jgi:hypothetical protein